MDPSYLGRPIPVPTTQKSSGIVTKRTFFIIIGLLLVIIAGIFLLSNSGDQSGALQQRLLLRQKATLDILNDGQKNITSPDLLKINSELRLLITGSNSNTETIIKKNAGKKKAKKDKTVIASESSAATLEKLNEAKLNARYDHAYQDVLTQKLMSLNSLNQELYDKSKSKSLREALSQQYEDITKYINELKELPAI